MTLQATGPVGESRPAGRRTLAQYLDTLYQTALTEPVDAFPLSVIRVLMETIGIEGAMLGLGCGCPRQLHLAMPREAFPAVDSPNGFTADVLLDGAAEAYLRQSPGVQPIDCTRPGKEVPDVFAGFVRRARIRHLLLHGMVSGAGLKWILLYRRSAEGFTEADAASLQELMPHIARCIEMNQRSALDGLDGRRSHRSSALADESGAIKAADPGFVALLLQEWPASRGGAVPRQVMVQLAAGKPFLGRAIQIEAVRHDGQLVLHAKKNPGASRLTPAEQEVASRFAAGRSTKEIAAELGVSPNTVRTQLSHLYSKLDVHDKAQLAQRLMAA